MKWILLFIFIPCLTKAQTAHVEGDKILYKDEVSVDGISKAILYNRAVKAIANNVHPVDTISANTNSDSSNKEAVIRAKGSIKLTSDYPTKKMLSYVILLKVKDGGYSYQIDNFDIKQAKRGGKAKDVQGEDVLKDMDKSGKPSEDAEKLLNEIDMDMQKLLSMIKRDMSKE